MKNLTSWIIIILLSILIWHINNQQEKIDVINRDIYNTNVSLDSIKTFTKDGQIYNEKLAYVSNDILEIKKFNKKFYNELKKDIKNLEHLTHLGLSIHDTVYITNDTVKQLPDSTWEVTYQASINDTGFSTDFLIKSILVYDSTLRVKERVIKDYKMKLDLYVGHTRVNDSLKVFVRSPYAGIKLEHLDSWVLIQKSKEPSFVFGPHIGIGYTPNRPSIHIGAGVTWNIKPILKKIIK